MTGQDWITPLALVAARADADQERARADTFEGLSKVQAAGLDELAQLAHELRSRGAGLATAARSARPVSPREWRTAIARVNGLAGSLDRAATGYAGARVTDMAYRTILDDLRAYGWTPRPEREPDRTLPTASVAEQTDNRRGYRRSWQRGRQWIILWFTGPYTVACATASLHGRLVAAHDMRSVITSPPPSAAELSGWHTAAGRAGSIEFDASYAQAAGHVTAVWGQPVETYRCDERGVRRIDGTGVSAVWTRPRKPTYRVEIWGIGDEPAHVRYWVGPVVNMAHLTAITSNYRSGERPR
jgi:hypothetical protein